MAPRDGDELPEGTSEPPTMVDRPAARSPDEAATPEVTARVDRRAGLFPGGSLPGNLSMSRRASETTIIAAADAMRADEIARVHWYFRVIALFVLGCLIALPFLEGDLLAKWLFGGGLAAYALSLGAFVLVVRRNPDAYNERNFFLLGPFGLAAAFTGVHYFGPFSAAPCIVVMALYYNSLIGSSRYTLFILLGCLVLQGALGAAVMSGALPDRGVIPMGDLDRITQAATQVLILGAYLATYMIARLSRATTHQQMSQFEQAVRDVAAREALLTEARQELERAAWVGGPGRFTEQQVGSFRLGVIIGRGAMGEVYEGVHVGSGEPAAIKLLHRNILADASQLQRFAREARAAAAIDSAHVVRVLEVADPSSPVPYLAMERMVGDDLAGELRTRRRLGLSEVVELVDQAARGLAAATAAGIVHRDLKPQNLFFARGKDGSGTWKILDFGVSKLADAAVDLTQGKVVGTPAYMSPEQARGREVDHRADIYALGAVCYRALTGQPPFTARDVPQLLYAVAHKMPRRPGALVDLPPDLDLVLALAMAKRPEDRFASAPEMAAAMRDAARGQLDPQLRKRAAASLVRVPWAAGN
jgi:serine/threonine-protein kinase